MLPQNASTEQATVKDVREASSHLAKPGTSIDLCSEPVEVGKAHCFAKKRDDIASGSSVNPNIARVGYQPSDLQAAYNLPSNTAGAGKTVAIVAAYDNPHAYHDLLTYRTQFGIGCNGCTFTQLDQRGGTRYPAYDSGWAGEISLDIEMVSAICPKCNILLIEADSNSFEDLAAGVDRAARLGANAISNSYGGSEFRAMTSLQSHYNHPGTAITASTGDDGYGPQWPAASRYVTAVGGTSLIPSLLPILNTRGWDEKVWGYSMASGLTGGAGSGCSAYIPKPSWQTDTGCNMRTIGDVAAVADPDTGVAVYSTSDGGWVQVGGTSVSAPIIASVYALAGNTSSINDSSYPYSHTSSLNDVTLGSNGICAADNTFGATPNKKNKRKHHKKNNNKKNNSKKGKKHQSPVESASLISRWYLCNGVQGYDGPTGSGTPNGTGAF